MPDLKRLAEIKRHWIEAKAEDGFGYWPHRSGQDDIAFLLRELEAGGWRPGTFSPDEVLALDQYQRGEGKWVPPHFRMHPFTCPNRGDGNHRANSVDLGALVPTVCGWICPYCDYTQNWAHDHMKASPPGTSDGSDK